MTGADPASERTSFRRPWNETSPVVPLEGEDAVGVGAAAKEALFVGTDVPPQAAVKTNNITGMKDFMDYTPIDTPYA